MGEKLGLIKWMKLVLKFFLCILWPLKDVHQKVL